MGEPAQRIEGITIPDERPMIYVVRCGNYVKIGMTRGIHQRLAAIRAHNPENVVLLALIPGGVAMERDIHEQFAEYRHRFEWFHIAGRVQSWINGRCQVRFADDG